VIQTLDCAANTKVKAGQICAKIDPLPYQTVGIRATPIWRQPRIGSKRQNGSRLRENGLRAGLMAFEASSHFPESARQFAQNL